MTIREKAQDFLLNNSPLRWDDLVEFAREMCELQKKECEQNAKINKYTYFKRGANVRSIEKEFDLEVWGDDTSFTVDKDSILNCKNVCDE